MHTERFLELRRDTLKPIFTVKNIAKVWRKIVRQQLRKLEIRDIYDHYDFNYNIEERAATIRRDILNGSYAVSAPLIYEIEKKLGVCRHMIAPQPQDALVLQVLVESFAEQLLEHQPSKNAMFSRDKHNMAKPHEGREYGEPLRKLWMRLQKKIYKFNRERKLMVVTDLSNYYDSINMTELKKVIHGHVATDEVVIDLMFSVLQGISWQPDYLPYTHRGLPTSNIEAIRILAHALLFEVDEVLKRKTDNSFARWMDDIVFGADDRKSAIDSISGVSVLSARPRIDRIALRWAGDHHSRSRSPSPVCWAYSRCWHRSLTACTSRPALPLTHEWLRSPTRHCSSTRVVPTWRIGCPFGQRSDASRRPETWPYFRIKSRCWIVS